MRTETSKNIVKFVREHKEVSPKMLEEAFPITAQALFRHLKKLVEAGKLEKVGQAPHVRYKVGTKAPAAHGFELDPRFEHFLDEEFLYISPTGQRLEKARGFVIWCHLHGYSPNEKALALQKASEYRQNGLIDGLPKLQSIFPAAYVDALYYLDYFALENFGKTKLGTLVLYGKQAQDRQLIDELYENIAPAVREFVIAADVDAVAFIPPTIPRAVQLQNELKKRFEYDHQGIKIFKSEADNNRPQKSLQSIHERMGNARRSIHISLEGNYNNVLLFDDAVGSGATLNETARKLRESGKIGGKIYGLGIVGAQKQFDILSEV